MSAGATDGAPGRGVTDGAPEGGVLLLGGTSEIGLAIVRRLAQAAPRAVVLAGRDPQGLERAAADLRAAGAARVRTLALEALDTGAHAELIERALARPDGVRVAIVAVGTLGEADALAGDAAEAVRALQVNLVGAGSLLIQTARGMRARGGGTIIVLSSIAAQRPRRANAAYGASKAGLDALARALDDELHGEGVRIVVVRPGFVHTRMTRGLAPAPLASTPAAVAEAVVRGLERGARTVWAPRALRGVALVLRALPRPLFRRISR